MTLGEEEPLTLPIVIANMNGYSPFSVKYFEYRERPSMLVYYILFNLVDRFLYSFENM